jgi:serine/threonine protein kinase
VDDAIVDSRYRLERQLGHGSMGEVWLAVDHDGAATDNASDHDDSPDTPDHGDHHHSAESMRVGSPA